MAKLDRKESYKNAVIDTKDMTITEITKDGDLTYDLKKVLESWNGIEGISLAITKSDDKEPDK